jgi:hypothetical protein
MLESILKSRNIFLIGLRKTPLSKQFSSNFALVKNMYEIILVENCKSKACALIYWIELTSKLILSIDGKL